MSDEMKKPARTIVPVLVGCLGCAMERAAGVEAPPSSGPSKVTNEAYRDGWEMTFGGKRPQVGQA